MMTVISEGRFLGNGIEFLETMWYNLGVRVDGRLARVNRKYRGVKYEFGHWRLGLLDIRK